MPPNRSRRPARRYKDWGAIGDALLAAEAEDEGAAEVLQKSCHDFEDTVDGAYVQTDLRRGEHINPLSVLHIRKLNSIPYNHPCTVRRMHFGLAHYFSFLRVNKTVGLVATNVDPTTIFRYVGHLRMQVGVSHVLSVKVSNRSPSHSYLRNEWSPYPPTPLHPLP